MVSVRAIIFQGKRTAGKALATIDENYGYAWIDDVAVITVGKLGFTRVGVPRAQADDAKSAGIEVVPLGTVREAFDLLLGAPVKRERPRPETPAATEGERR